MIALIISTLALIVSAAALSFAVASAGRKPEEAAPVVRRFLFDVDAEGMRRLRGALLSRPHAGMRVTGSRCAPWTVEVSADPTAGEPALYVAAAARDAGVPALVGLDPATWDALDALDAYRRP